MMSHVKKILIYIGLSVVLAACNSGGGGGGGSGGGSGGGAGAGGGGGAPSPYAMRCDTGNSTVLEGCWAVETCVFNSTDPGSGTSYFLRYFIAFRNDNTMTEHVYTYTNSNCIGTPFATYDQPFISDYAIGAAYTSDEGLASNYFAKTWNIGGFTGTDYTGFHIDVNTRLCFAGNDLIWTATGGGLGMTAQSTGAVNTSINTTLCMVRI